MQLKASTDYGLRAVLYLAHKGGLCSSRDIARDMCIPRDYLIQLAQLLRNAGIVQARPGKHGGYQLAKPSADITLLEVTSALDADAKLADRGARIPRGGGAVVEKVQRAYALVLDSYDAYLDSITIDMLLACSKDAKEGEAYLSERLRAEGTRLAAQRVPYR